MAQDTSLPKRHFKLRDATLDDVPQIEALAKRFNFPLPDKFHSCAVVEKDGKIVAFAVLRTILEAIMVSDLTAANVKHSVDLLVNEAKSRATNLEYNNVYAFVPNEVFSGWLTKYHGFKDTIGKSLILGVNDGE